MEAVKLLTPQSPAKLVVDVLRQASMSCCVWMLEMERSTMRQLSVKQENTEIIKARLMIEQAVRQVKIRTI